MRLFRKQNGEEEDARKTEQALERTRKTWFSHLTSLFERSRIDDSLWEELEELLIGADAGVATAQKVLEDVQRRVQKEGLKDPSDVRDALKDELVAILGTAQPRGKLWRNGEGPEPVARPAVILVVGVNGTGKTTSIGKLAYAYRQDDAQVTIAAADTFRAAAIEQMREWGDLAGAEVIAHKQGADPGAVVFDALSAAESRGADVLIIDTAGRLHTKFNLMEELRKILRVIQRKDPTAPHEVLLVLDATTGQNALIQAKAFAEAVDVTAICLAKLDGTSKGGMVFAISDQLGVPVRFIGTGERPEDLSPFSAEEFVEALFQ
ncbi:MAG: signal recognition particle-docking protein FtsY [Dehalococcoidia bacterium]|nr:signal recognition particle-docking protein FtsY [Dehalococcoidia bacterium]